MSTLQSAVEADQHGRRKMRILGWISVVTTAILVATSLTAYGFYRQLAGNIRQQDVLGMLGNDRPQQTDAENILLVGSDTRAGQGGKYGAHVSGARSDTLILLHLSANRNNAVLVSFPRDSIVEIPSCQDRTGAPLPPRTGMVNQAFSLGGPACSWRTIESITGLRIDHFVQIDFSGFSNMVDALGGVEICLSEPVNDPRADLRLPAGRHVVNGDQALGYVRTRYGLGDGSDLDRIKRQQKFMAAVIKKATSTRLLFDPGRLYRFLDAATRSVSTDRQLALTDLKRLAESVKGLGTGEVTFVTVPNQPAPADPNRLVWRQPAANQLFAALRNDTPLPSSRPPPGPSGAPAPAVPPSEVQVRVLNGTEIAGLAGRTADELGALGFQVVDVGNSATPSATTAVRYAPGMQQQAATVAGVLQGARATVHHDLPAGTVEVVIGNDWQGVGAPGPGGPGGATPQPGTPSPMDTLTAADDICAPT